jgi:DNA-binding transcriptional LysR family regulator
MLFKRGAAWHPPAMIDKLELLLLLARERHFGRAAEAAGISQPSLSAAVKSLEDQFGMVMVERGSRFRGFTPEGERVLDWARRLVADARNMRQDIEAMKRGIGGHLRIGVIPTALPFVTSMTLPFHERYPAVQFTVTSLTSIAILAAMENLELDLGISYIDNEAIGRFQTVPLYEERYALLVAQHHPLASRDTIGWAETGNLPLCLLTPDMQNRRIIDRHLAAAGVAAQPTFESNSMMLLHVHVQTGKWVGIVAARFAEVFDRLGALRMVPIVEPAVTQKIGLIAPDREPFTPLVAAFVAAARKIAGADGATGSGKAE